MRRKLFDKLICNKCVIKNKVGHIVLNTNYIRQINKKYINVKEYLNSRFAEEDDSLGETIVRIFFHVEEKPLCKTCKQNHTKFNYNRSLWQSKGMYQEYCSPKCAAQNELKIKKGKSTCLVKYSVETNLMLPEVKKKILNRHGVKSMLELKWVIDKSHTKEALKKSNETKRKNHTFNTSNSEEKTFEILKEKYPDVIRQYKSDEYPFCCDFYIPSIDTYIECNYHWTHGGHPYNEEKDKEKLEKWKSKHRKFYDNAIKTWTIRDVEKRRVAKENNLNFIEVWNVDEIFKCMSILIM